jgi:hypothetical protein
LKPRTVMLYGISGSTKSSQAYHAAKYIFKTTGKRLRMIHSDPGGYAAFEDSGMLDRGEVEVFDFSNREYALSDFRKLSDGYWPRKLASGGWYFQKDDKCKTTEEEFKGIGGYIIDGISSIGEVLKNHCSDQTEGVGFKESWKFEEDGYTIVGLQQGHYGLVQKEIHGRITRGFATLPVPWIIYTALVGKGEDKQNRETVYGPQVVGSASTPNAPTWFMDCLHLSKEKWEEVVTPLHPSFKTNPEKLGSPTGVTKEGMVAWFMQHKDAVTDVPYLCKPRVAPELYPELLKYFPQGFVPLGYKQGIDLYFLVLDKLRKEMRG